ncbi:MAG: hypothetical protein L3J13_10220 [Devosiaceae bacterium]|nr:hypothetical protein [Devosiaceae bacterium]
MKNRENEPVEPHQRDESRLNRRFDQLEQKAPGGLGRIIAVLRQPIMVWVRIPLGVILVIGGLFSILPLLGIWMLPLGLLLLAVDLAFLRAPVNGFALWVERKWSLWRRK